MIELLVCLAILSILSALLLPALVRGKAAGRQAECLNNHRLLVVGWHADSGDEGGLPLNADFIGRVRQARNWVGGDMQDRFDSRNAALLVDPERSSLGALVGDARLFKCPADLSGNVRSVSMNNRLNPFNDAGVPACTGGWGSNYLTYPTLESIRNPAGIFMILSATATACLTSPQGAGMPHATPRA